MSKCPHQHLARKHGIRRLGGKKYTRLYESAQRIESIMGLDVSGHYASLDVEALHRSEPYRLMMAECERAEARRK